MQFNLNTHSRWQQAEPQCKAEIWLPGHL